MHKERPRKIRLDKTIHRLSEADRFQTAVDIHREISTRMNTQINIHTVRRLVEVGLKGCVACKKPGITQKNRKARLAVTSEQEISSLG